MSDTKYEARPWGHYEVIHSDELSKTKKITIYPGKRISYQKHLKRNENWTIVKGVGYCILDDETMRIGRGSIITVPTGVKHRIANDGSEPLIFIEVQYGELLDENDIIRYDDDYGRKTEEI